MIKLLLYVLVLKLCFWDGFGHKRSRQDYEGLQSLMAQLENPPPSWHQSDNPCDAWEGISCDKSRVTVLNLNSMGIKGTLADDIGRLSELKTLDLASNKDLGGNIPNDIGNLTKLERLILLGCSFNGTIPDTIGNLVNLQFLDVNSNQLNGNIPPSLGHLSNLYWLDLSNNSLTGSIPISTVTQPGLDQLSSARHLHFSKNQLSGSIPEKLFSTQMKLIHVLFDGNQLSGSIPHTIGLVQTIEILQLGRNSLEGLVPSNLKNLSKVYILNLANNNLSGPLPDLSGMSSLQYVDLSNNQFDPSESPAWLMELQSLITLVIKNGTLRGEVPSALFSHPTLVNVILDDNKFSGTFNMGNISAGLKQVSLERNNISNVLLSFNYNGIVKLSGNPVCNSNNIANKIKSEYCNLSQNPPEPYSTDLTRCNSHPCPPNQLPSSKGCTCPTNQSLNPQSCTCEYPYEGILVFRVYHEIPSSNVFQELEDSLRTQLKYTPYLYNPVINNDSYLQVGLKIFPSDQTSFTRSEVLTIGFELNNQTYALLVDLGPYNFLASPYINENICTFNFDINTDKTGARGLKIGLSVACALLVVLIAAALYTFKKKNRAKRAVELSRPFEDGTRVPKMRGARWFTYDELRKITNDFSENNELGSGGYGKVYMGMVPTGQLLAIKRAKQESVQGSHEFNTEIELLSRVHHKNLVALVGFYFDREDQMLVYEFIPNGSLRDSLSGKSGVHLDWRRRLRVALDSARGLAYLHEHADPPIIHRDVKSSNILLDENLSAKVSDFGLSKLVYEVEKRPISSKVKGTLGYLDPEYYMTQELTKKSDVYSFGVVMLELITGKHPFQRGRYIVHQVKTTLNKTEEEYWGLKDMIDSKILSTTPLAAFTKFLDLALKCVEELAVDRPTMSEVVKEIESMLQNDESFIHSNSAASSSGSHSKGIAIRHPYFDSSG